MSWLLWAFRISKLGMEQHFWIDLHATSESPAVWESWKGSTVCIFSVLCWMMTLLVLDRDICDMHDLSDGSSFGLLKLVFDYFCERTPRSYVETRETSLVWNYKYAGNLSFKCSAQLGCPLWKNSCLSSRGGRDSGKRSLP